MIGNYPKRLIEVDLPIARISAHARREKSIRHGHISTLHIWWARRPLAACRAVILASLWPDPVDLTEWAKEGEEMPAPQGCKLGEGIVIRPARFLAEARQRMASWAQIGLGKVSAESGSRLVAIQKNPKILDDPAKLRAALLDFIADFANWDNSTDREYLHISRALTQAAHEALGGAPGTRPLLLDPFAGGGSIPLEALRVGADSFASDLNPVAVLLNKVVLEYIPKYGQSLADEVRKWGEWIKREAEEELGEFYPKGVGGATPIAYLWARTIQCEGPGCGAEVPLIHSLWLARKGATSVALRILPKPKGKRVEFDIIQSAKSSAVGPGTVQRSSAICPCCGYTTSAERTRSQFKGRRGGAADARMFAVITSSPDRDGRAYQSPTRRDVSVAAMAEAKLRQALNGPKNRVLEVPSEQLPYLRSIFNINLLDVSHWKDLFSPRQLLALLCFNRLAHQARKRIGEKLDSDFTIAVTTCLALVVDRLADKLSSLARWDTSRENAQGTFGRQALGIVWDFCEVNPFSGAGGDWGTAVDWIARVIERESLVLKYQGQVQQASSTECPLPDDSVALFVTDPPYYDAVPYADLSDFFYVWLRRSIRDIHPALFEGELTPKKLEVVQLAERNPIYAFKTKENFEALMCKSLAEGRRVTQPQGLGLVVFAHKTTSAWEVMLQAVIDAGWIIVASWPIDTEMGSRLRAMNSATLASSVHLVGRPGESRGGATHVDVIGDWREVLQALPRRIHEWMSRLAAEGVVGADAIFACLGPGLEIFSRFSRVEKASGEAVLLKEYLEQVWAAIAKEALMMVFAGADVSGFEADARLTAMWLWTVNASKGDAASREAMEEEGSNGGEKGSEGGGRKPSGRGFVLEYDAARKIAQGLGGHLENMGTVVEVVGETARLLPVDERARFLFGKETLPGMDGRQTRGKRPRQGSLFEEVEVSDNRTGAPLDDIQGPRPGTTVLDKVHQSMILFASGRGEALKRFLVEDGVGKDPRFWRLADALAALYPRSTDERRWVEGVLARKKGVGF